MAVSARSKVVHAEIDKGYSKESDLKNIAQSRVSNCLSCLHLQNDKTVKAKRYTY